MLLINSIFPKQCVFCSKIGEDICNNCLKKIPHSLPQCPICHKLNNGYYTHKKCSSKPIQCFTGWSISREQEFKLKQKASKGITSVYRYLLRNMISYLQIEEIVKNSFILPIHSEDHTIYTLNNTLCKEFKSHGKKQYMLLVGFSIEEIDWVIKETKTTPKYTEIKILTLFNTFTQ